MSIQSKIEAFRREYDSFELKEENLPKNPLVLFDSWMNDAMDSDIKDPNAMVVSTVDEEGKPSSRIVLLRNFDEKGFVFFTNYNSQKGKEALNSKYIAINFYWDSLDKQVRISGSVERTSSEQSDKYFEKRPKESQLSACASAQSSILKNREELEAAVKQLKKEFADKEIPRPSYWGGLLVKPEKIEFWQGRPARLHDRFLYSLQAGGTWMVTRLAP